MNHPSETWLVGRTSVFCFACDASHEAVVEREGNRIVGRVTCPRGERAVTLSSDAEVFLDLREKAARAEAQGGPGRFRPLVNLLSITDQCNFRCPVCYAASGLTENASHLPLGEIARRGQAMRRLGAKQVLLTGGEPTLHPDLPDIVRCLCRAGLRVFIATNGLRFAESPAYLRQLKKAGLWKVNLQFDTLDESVHEKLRGNRLVDAKIQAARNAVAAGVRLGFLTTVTTLNLHDVGRVVEFGLSLFPPATTISIQAASIAGRYTFGEDTLVDREQIIGELLQCEALGGITRQDLWPLPTYRPWSLRVHPDCATNLIFLRDGERLRPWTHAVDVERLYRKLARCTMRGHWIARNLVPLAYALSAVRRGNAGLLLRCFAGYLGNARRWGAVVIGVGAFLNTRFWDQQRIANCATAEWTDAGPVSPCVRYVPVGCRDGRLAALSASSDRNQQ